VPLPRVVSVLKGFSSILKCMKHPVSLYIVALHPPQGDALKDTASTHLAKLIDLIRAKRGECLPSAILILSKSGTIDTIPVQEKGLSLNDLGRAPSFVVLFCEGDFEWRPPTKNFIEQLRFIFRTLSVVYPLSRSTIRSIVNRGEEGWLIAESGVHPLYLIEQLQALCSELTTYRDSLKKSDGWYSASFQEFRTFPSRNGKSRITGWVQNTGVHSWKCGSALGAVRLGLVGTDAEGGALELRFDFQRSTIFPGEGSYFEFEFHKPWTWIEIDCVVEGNFWFGKANFCSQVFRATRERDEKLIECIANKDILLLLHSSKSELASRDIALLQAECEALGLDLQYEFETPVCDTSYDLLYVDFEKVSPSIECILALRRSAYEFADIRASAPLFIDPSLDVILCGTMNSSAHFERVLWNRSLGGIRRRVVDGVSVGCFYVRNISSEELERIKKSAQTSPNVGSPILLTTSFSLELLDGGNQRARSDRMLYSGEELLS
jgi:hypothetical protein